MGVRGRELPPSFVLKYYLYQATISQGFVIPILVAYVRANGLSYVQLGTLEAVFMASWTLGEIPTGYVGDRIGRRNSLILGSALVVVAILGFAVSSSFAGFAAAYVIWALGVTFKSGTGSAWLYDLLQERLDADQYAHVNGRGRAIWLVVTAVTSIVGAYLATLSWFYPFAANGVLVAGSVFLLFTFPESEQYEDGDTDQLPVRTAVRLIAGNFSKPPLRSFVIYTALFFGVVETVATFTQPVSRSVGVSVAQLGLLYAGFHVASAFVASYTGAIKDRVGIRQWFRVALPAVGVVLAGVAFLPLVAVPAILLVRVVDSVTKPLKAQYLNDNVESVGRATVLSAASMTGALAAVAFRLLGGFVADVTSDLTMFALLGAGFVACTAIVLILEPPAETGIGLKCTPEP